MQFVVNEQASTNTAMVHRCNCKQAQSQERQSVNIRVHGPFTTGEQAMNAAGKTGRKTVRFCVNCRP